MEKICIVGSCVTRDIWRVVGQEFKGKYFARTSFISMMSPPVHVDIADIKLDSDFQRDTVLADASRTALQWIMENKPDKLIIDFIDERFDVFDISGTYLVRSVELLESGLVERVFPTARLIDRMSAECTELWQRATAEFVEFMQNHSPSTKIILHKARWSSEYTDGVAVASFGDKMVLMGREISLADYNAMNEGYFRIAELVFDDIVSVEAPPHLQMASKTHAWGISPVHYVDEYYQEIWRQLNSIV